jgi:hypothetical protein
MIKRQHRVRPTLKYYTMYKESVTLIGVLHDEYHDDKCIADLVHTIDTFIQDVQSYSGQQTVNNYCRLTEEIYLNDHKSHHRAHTKKNMLYYGNNIGNGKECYSYEHVDQNYDRSEKMLNQED